VIRDDTSLRYPPTICAALLGGSKSTSLARLAQKLRIAYESPSRITFVGGNN
jgi:hypothetical protein